MITYQRLAWKLDPIKTPDEEDREDYLFAARHCVLEEVRRRAWRMVEIAEIASGLSASAAWEKFREVARALAVEGRCPADPTSVRLAVQLTRWTISQSKPRALGYAELAWEACESLNLDPWTASNLRPVTLSQLAKCVEAIGGNGEFLIRSAVAELRTSTGKKERAETLFLVAAVLRLKDRQRAIEAAKESAALFEGLGQNHLQGRVLLLLADLIEEAGRTDLSEAIAVARLGLERIDWLQDPNLYQLGLLNLADFEVMAGDLEGAAEVLGSIQAFRVPTWELQRRWMNARFQLLAGSLASGYGELSDVAVGFAELGRIELRYSVMADMAVALKLLGKTSAAKETAALVRAFFRELPDPPAYVSIMEQIEAEREVDLTTLRSMWRAS
ncbi:MAG: hypothetical protein AAGD06_17055 [Acidobacteriota bacterium]